MNPESEASGYKALLQSAIGKRLARVGYGCLAGEIDEGEDVASVDSYIGGEVELAFHDGPVLFLTWAENVGWPDAFSLAVHTRSSFLPGSIRLLDASSLDLWQNTLGHVLEGVAMVGWNSTPHVVRFDFDNSSILVGTSDKTTFSDADDVLVLPYEPGVVEGADCLWSLGCLRSPAT